jgi:hypothetical protein
LFYKKSALPQPEADLVKALEKVAFDVLETAMNFQNARTYIITNA